MREHCLLVSCAKAPLIINLYNKTHPDTATECRGYSGRLDSCSRPAMARHSPLGDGGSVGACVRGYMRCSCRISQTTIVMLRQLILERNSEEDYLRGLGTLLGHGALGNRLRRRLRRATATRPTLSPGISKTPTCGRNCQLSTAPS